MTEEKMIPLSVIDAEIDYLKNECWINEPNWVEKVVNVLEKLKKEAISFPIFSIMEPSLEQKIKDRIAFLESPRLITANLFDNMLDARIVDELRKLLE